MRTQKLAFATFLVLLPLALIAQTNEPPVTQIPDPKTGQALVLALIPVIVPVIVSVLKWLLQFLPAWTLPIIATGLGELLNFISGLVGGPSVGVVQGLALGAAGVGVREIVDQISKLKAAKAGTTTLLLCLGMLGTSCTTVPDDASIRRIARVAKEAAIQTTEEMLISKPEWRDEFVAAHTELVSLESAATLSVDDLLRIIGKLPVKELKSDEARIAVRGARLIIALTGWSEIDAERLTQLRPIVTAIREGLEEGGLGQ